MYTARYCQLYPAYVISESIIASIYCVVVVVIAVAAVILVVIILATTTAVHVFPSVRVSHVLPGKTWNISGYIIREN
jgi:hypothetical protein